MSKIHEAVQSGNLGEVARTIQESPNMINAPDESGNTPLHLAVVVNNPEMVSLLLEKGGDRSAVANMVGTPLQTAELFLATARTNPALPPEIMRRMEKIRRLLSTDEGDDRVNDKLKGIADELVLKASKAIANDVRDSVNMGFDLQQAIAEVVRFSTQMNGSPHRLGMFGDFGEVHAKLKESLSDGTLRKGDLAQLQKAIRSSAANLNVAVHYPPLSPFAANLQRCAQQFCCLVAQDILAGRYVS